MVDADPSLLERAQKTLEKEGVGDLTNTNTQAGLIIPEPYYIDKDGNRTNLTWDVNEETYTLTLQFTAPGQGVGGDVITGESGSYLGMSMTVSNFNADGKDDVIANAVNYNNTYIGAMYIFHADSSIPVATASADVIIKDEEMWYDFCMSMVSEDVNGDGATDLIVESPGICITCWSCVYLL